ncbi:hypothetical protein T492DRAFT_835047 [Pavlovales sp. CCMP2436]|nr:hypothetical protein T492DRAFT_835047 [Pavlovales sp. CCMP2436]
MTPPTPDVAGAGEAEMAAPAAPAALAGAGVSEADLEAPAVLAAGASASEQLADDELACPICLQPLLEPMLTSCGHAFCAHCIGRALSPPELYQAEYRLECPLCRGQVGILQESPGLADAVTQRYGTDFADRRRQDADVPHQSLPKPERDEPREQLMAALKQQGGYKTLALNVTLDLSSGGWESMPACLPELRSLRQLRVENNLLRSLEHLRLPALLALVAHHNQIQHIGNQLFGAPNIVRLDLSHNLLSKVDGLSELHSLQSLNLSHNKLASVEGLADGECSAGVTPGSPTAPGSFLRELLADGPTCITPLPPSPAETSISAEERPISADRGQQAVGSAGAACAQPSSSAPLSPSLASSVK